MEDIHASKWARHPTITRMKAILLAQNGKKFRNLD